MLYALLNVVAVSFSLQDQLLLLFLNSFSFKLDYCFLVLRIASFFPNMITEGTVSYLRNWLGNIPLMLCDLDRLEIRNAQLLTTKEFFLIHYLQLIEYPPLFAEVSFLSVLLMKS